MLTEMGSYSPLPTPAPGGLPLDNNLVGKSYFVVGYLDRA